MEVSGSDTDGALERTPEQAFSRLGDLIGRIYDCALEPALWDDTLARIVAAYAPPGWEVAALIWERFSPPAARFIGSAGIAPLVREIFVGSFAGRNPWSRALNRFPVGTVVDTDQATPRAEFRRSPLYTDFLRAFGFELAVAVTFDRRPAEDLGLVMLGPPDRDLTELKRGLRLLAPHFQRAARITRALGAATLRAEAAEGALDRAPGAVITLTPDLGLVNVNAKARRLADEGWIRLAAGRLLLGDAAARSALAAFASGRADRSAVFTIRGPGGGPDDRPMAVLAARMAPGRLHALAGSGEEAAIVLSFESGGQTALMGADRLAAWYGLTGAEARLAAALAEGADLGEFAARRNVTLGAIRFHLKSIYRKTGAGSRAQLVARLRDLPAMQ